MATTGKTTTPTARRAKRKSSPTRTGRWADQTATARRRTVKLGRELAREAERLDARAALLTDQAAQLRAAAKALDADTDLRRVSPGALNGRRVRRTASNVRLERS